MGTVYMSASYMDGRDYDLIRSQRMQDQGNGGDVRNRIPGPYLMEMDILHGLSVNISFCFGDGGIDCCDMLLHRIIQRKGFYHLADLTEGPVGMMVVVMIVMVFVVIIMFMVVFVIMVMLVVMMMLVVMIVMVLMIMIVMMLVVMIVMVLMIMVVMVLVVMMVLMIMIMSVMMFVVMVVLMIVGFFLISMDQDPHLCTGDATFLCRFITELHIGDTKVIQLLDHSLRVREKGEKGSSQHISRSSHATVYI